jgi:glyoxylase-like metal-dependent hydrolase (beta-lactamase superfamily II)
MTHRLNLVLLALITLVAVPFYWLMLANPARGVEPMPVHIAQLRSLAAAMPGPAPISVSFVDAGWKRVPGNFYAAGSGMKRRLLGVIAFRLDVPGRGPIEASLILATSERPLHLGGLAAFASRPGSAMPLARARLDPHQVPGTGGVAWPRGLTLRPESSALAPHAVAPGVVAIPTGAPSPGSRLYYVRLADGRELVFAGDLAPFNVNSAELRVRSNLLDRDEPAGARPRMMRWLVTLRLLEREAPGLIVVPAHDQEWLRTQGAKSGIRPLD